MRPPTARVRFAANTNLRKASAPNRSFVACTAAEATAAASDGLFSAAARIGDAEDGEEQEVDEQDSDDAELDEALEHWLRRRAAAATAAASLPSVAARELHRCAQ